MKSSNSSPNATGIPRREDSQLNHTASTASGSPACSAFSVLGEALDVAFASKGVGRVIHNESEKASSITMIFAGCSVTVRRRHESPDFELAVSDGGLCNSLAILDKIDWGRVIDIGGKPGTAGDTKSVANLVASQRFVTTGEVVGRGDDGTPVVEFERNLKSVVGHNSGSESLLQNVIGMARRGEARI